MFVYNIRGHCVKSVRIRNFSGPYFPAFELNTRHTPYHSVFSMNAGKYGPEKLSKRTLSTQWVLLQN